MGASRGARTLLPPAAVRPLVHWAGRLSRGWDVGGRAGGAGRADLYDGTQGVPSTSRAKRRRVDCATGAFRRGCRAKSLLSGGFKTISGMPQNFLACDRDQSFLLAPDVREWLPENHLAWFVIDAVAVMGKAGVFFAHPGGGPRGAGLPPGVNVGL